MVVPSSSFLQFEASVQTRVISDLETRIQSKVEELRMEARNGVDVEVKRQADAEKERLALQVSIPRFRGSSIPIFRTV